ncbi:MAG: tyrosine-type recombinase/integrase [Rhodospirillaceae bacterium]|nr:tyrosine-type recombinase/integrase [Rhodospirillaceae bacterium]
MRPPQWTSIAPPHTHTMAKAGIVGVHACPKGLRHGFGVSALQKAVPLNMVRKWLGHSRLSTTAIYADAMGDEEREIATRFWNSFS